MNFPSSSTHNQGNRFQALLNEGRDMVLVFLSAHLNDLFNSTDEVLLDFAEHAESTAIQSHFIEAIGGVRKYQAEIESMFRKEIHNGFDEFLQPPLPPDDEKTRSEELELIKREDMDESVAVEDLITQSRSNYFTQLYALGQRLAVLSQGRIVLEREIPAGPTQVVSAFRVSIHSLDIDSKAKIVLYALFNKFVMRHLQGMYDEFNDNLKNAHILPNLKSAFVKSVSPVPRAPQGEEQHKETQSTAMGDESERMSDADTSAQTSLGEDLFGSILHLLAACRNAPSGVAHDASTQRVEDAGDAAGGAVVSPGGSAAVVSGEDAVAAREQLMSTIDSVRPRSVGHGDGVLSNLEALPKVAVDPNFLNTLKGVITGEREAIFAQIPPEQMQGNDVDVIDLVGMLFEYMLIDPLLPNLAKALLSHLHTPYLKMSLSDSTLLVDSEHPARELFDLLVEAGGQWVYENDVNRGIFPQMQITVNRVLEEFSDNDELLPDLLEYFTAAMDAHRRKSEAVEQRAQESVKGREKLQMAKQRAAKEIHSRTRHATRLPRSAERFLTQAWTDRLAFILLRQEEGELSEEWNRTLQIADELIWLFGPEGAEADEKEIRQVGSAVQEEIEKVLESLGGYHQRHLNELFELLGNPSAVAHWHEEHTQTPYSEPATSDSASLIRSTMPPSDSGEDASGQPAFKPVSQPSQFDKDTSERKGPLSEPEQEMLEQLQQLQFGTWFEFRGKDNAIQHLKLSWLSPFTGTCMFVDKSGAQAQIKTLMDTVRMMVSGEAKIIPKPKRKFVEQALLAIKKALQRSMRASD